MSSTKEPFGGQFGDQAGALAALVKDMRKALADPDGFETDDLSSDLRLLQTELRAMQKRLQKHASEMAGLVCHLSRRVQSLRRAIGINSSPISFGKFALETVPLFELKAKGDG